MSYLDNTKLKWDETGSREYETGVNHGVLYTMDGEGNYETGVVWNGLTSVSESPEGAEVTAIYADNIKYLNLMSAEDFKGTIEAYTYPDEFAKCDGSASLVAGIKIGQQTRSKFGICYTTQVGTDVNPEAGEKIHIVYNCLASPSERSYETVNDSPEAITFSWEFSTTPVSVTGHKPTALVTIDTTKFTDATKLGLIASALFGTTDTTTITTLKTILGIDTWTGDPMLLLPDQITAIVNAQ